MVEKQFILSEYYAISFSPVASVRYYTTKQTLLMAKRFLKIQNALMIF